MAAVGGWDFVALEEGVGVTAGEDWRDEDPDPNDFVGHGTGVAGLIGALSDNRIGVTGTAWEVRILPLRVGWSEVERQTGVVDMSYLAQAVRYATRMGAQVINISLSNTALLELDAAVDAALAAGVTVVVAAGNNDSPNWLKHRPGVIHVAATDPNDVLPRWTNLGPHVTLAAPGAAIPTTTLTRTGTDSLGLRQPSYIPDANGTSFSAPLVSGAVALLQANRRRLQLPLLTPEQVRLVLMGTCDGIAAQNPTVPADYYGAGRLNVANALTSGSGSARTADVGATLVGDAVDLTTSTAQRRAAVMAASGRLLFLEPYALELLGEAAMGGAPYGDLAAGDLGGGRGTGLFAALGGWRIGGYGGAGATLPGWPVSLPFSTTPPAVGDLDGDGLLDVVSVGSNAFDGSVAVIRAWDHLGRPKPGFPVTLGPYAGAAVRPALGDLDGIPGLEIVAADRDGRVYAIARDGRHLPGWPVLAPGGIPLSPVIGRHGTAPLVVVMNRSEWHGFSADGSEAVPGRVYTTIGPYDPALADLDGDGGDDVLLATPAQVHAWYLGDPPGSSQWPASSFGASFVGPPVVGHLAPTPGAEVLAPTIGAPRMLGADGGELDSRVPFSIARPALLPPATDQRTLLLGAASSTRLLSLDLDENSWASDPQPWPTSRANLARTGSRWDSPALGLADVEPPPVVTDLEAAAPGAHTVRLTWRSPAEGSAFGRAIEYDVRVSRAPIGDGDFPLLPKVPLAPPPRAGGEWETLTVHVEAAEAQYYARLRARDASGNWSALSNEASATTPLPEPVKDLRVGSTGEITLTMQWTTPGPDGWIGGPGHYEIRVSPLVMNEQEYARAPFRFVIGTAGPAGDPLATGIGPLPHDTHYWIGLRAVDSGGRESPLSNIADAWTQPRGAHQEDLEAPARIADLGAEVLGASAARLTWTAPSDDAPLGRAVEYDLRRSDVPITPESFVSQPRIPTPDFPRVEGEPETFAVDLPLVGSHHYALRSADAAGHWSEMSNVAALTAPAIPPAPVTDLRVAAVTESTLALYWSATGENGRIGRPDRYDIRVSPLPMSSSEFARAPFRFGVGATADAGAAESTMVGPLPQDTRYWVGLVAVDHGALASPLSNVVQTSTLPVGAHREDVEGPVPVADLRGEVLDRNQARLTWTAPSDDAAFARAVEYDVRKSSWAITPEIFGALPRLATPAFPRVAGERETVLVNAPASGTEYFALRAADAAGHWSGISNVVELIAPTTPPGPVGDLRVTARSESTLALVWTACGEDGQVGRPARYEIRASLVALTLENFERALHRVSIPATSAAGEPESTVVEGLSANTALWVALRAVDAYGVPSALSNQVFVPTPNSPGGGELSLTLGANPTRPPVVVSWTLAPSPPDERATLAIYDVRGRRVRAWSLASGPFGVVAWDGSDAGGRRLPAGLYFARLSARAGVVTRRFTLLW